MSLKRGVMLVVLFLVVMSAFVVGGITEAQREIEIFASHDDGWGCDDEDVSIGFEHNDDFNRCFPNANGGCLTTTIQTCGDCYDESACSQMKEGTIITQIAKENYFRSQKVSGSLAENMYCKNPKTNDNNQYLCARTIENEHHLPQLQGKHWWLRCSQDDLGSSVEVVSEERVYYCLWDTLSGQAAWIPADEIDESTDHDEDGVPSPLDCDDDDGSIYPEFDCKLTPAPDPHPRDPNRKKACDEGQCGEGETCRNNICHKKECSVIAAVDICVDEIDQDCDSIFAVCEASEQECTDSGYAWLDNTIRGGFKCCGATPNTLGATGKEQGSETEHLCVSNDRSDVSSETPLEGFEDKEWQWLPANNYGYTPLTINGIADKYYDVVSNGQKWVKCNNDKFGVSPDPTLERQGAVDPSTSSLTNTFYCYKENEKRFVWAQCMENDARTAKKRQAGDGLFTLPLVHNQLNMVEYQKYYPNAIGISFEGYTHLEAVVKFVEEPRSYFGIRLQIKDHDGDPSQDQNVIGYATERTAYPLKDEDEGWIHLKIPIGGYNQVGQVIFTGLPDEKQIEVRTAYLTRGQDNMFCSGITDSGVNSWINTLDKQGRVSGKKSCEAQFGTGSWVGDTETGFCCGNEGAENNPKGCFNGKPLAEGDTTGEVEINVGYKETLSGPLVPPSPKTFPCPSSTGCLIPLPGIPPYTLSNLHPELYSAWFWNDNRERKLLTETSTEFDEEGILYVQRVPQNIIRVTEEEESRFFSCASPDFISEQEGVTSLTLCQAAGESVCSPQKIDYPDLIARPLARPLSTVGNQWSTEGITEVGYTIEGEIPSSPEEVQSRLNLLSEEHSASARTHLSSVPPGRNLLANSGFIGRGDIFSWSLDNCPEGGEGCIESDLIAEKWEDKPNIVTLPAGKTFRSDHVPVSGAHQLSLTANTTCTQNIIVVNTEGGKEEAPVTNGLLQTPGNTAFVYVTFTAGASACTLHQPLLQLLAENIPPTPYTFFQTDIGTACCPENYCWTGNVCVKPMEEAYLMETVSEGNYYRCLNGAWTKSIPKNNWDGSQWGFCPQQEQCLVTAQGETNDISEFPTSIPSCINSEQYLLDRYCQEGNWTTRTKFLAAQLLEIGEQHDDYSLYCSNLTTTVPALLDRDINYLEKFFAARFLVGTNLVKPEENKLINNVCVLTYKEDGESTTLFATSLNKPLTDAVSFLPLIGLPGDNPALCLDRREGFESCTIGGFDLPEDAQLWYSEQYHSIVYGRGEFSLRQLNPSVWQKFTRWLAGLFGQDSIVEDSQRYFLQKAGNFNQLYILSQGDKQVRAVREVQGQKATLRAEYENFDTPVCDYITNLDYGQLGEERVACETQRNIQSVEVVEEKATSFFWPQLTGKLRVTVE